MQIWHEGIKLEPEYFYARPRPFDLEAKADPLSHQNRKSIKPIASFAVTLVKCNIDETTPNSKKHREGYCVALAKQISKDTHTSLA